MKRTLIVLYLLVSLGSSLEAQFSQDLKDSLQRVLTKYQETHKTVGLSAAVHFMNDTWQGVKGMSHVGAPLTTESIFALASISKTIVSACILQMDDEGIVDIDAPLRTYIDSIEYIPGYIPVKHLLNHTSGLYDYTFNPEFVSYMGSNASTKIDAEDVLKMYMKPPVSTPDKEYNYSNTNYVLLGMIIEKVSGKKYYTEIAQRFDFETQFPTLKVVPYERKVEDLAHLWLDVFGTGSPIDLIQVGVVVNGFFTAAGGAGAYSAQPRDVAKWIYKLGSGEILNASTMQAMTQVHKPSTAYGQGIEVNERLPCGTMTLGHHGNIGYRSYAMYEESMNVGIAIHSNDANADFLKDMSEELLCTYMDYLASLSTSEHRLWLEDARMVPNPITEAYQLEFSLLQAQDVSFYIYDLTGREVQNEYLGHFDIGDHKILRTNALTPGVYYFVIRTGSDGVVVKAHIVR